MGPDFIRHQSSGNLQRDYDGLEHSGSSGNRRNAFFFIEYLKNKASREFLLNPTRIENNFAKHTHSPLFLICKNFF